MAGEEKVLNISSSVPHKQQIGLQAIAHGSSLSAVTNGLNKTHSY